MSKDLYTIRGDTGQLMKYDGIGWANFGSFIPSSWPDTQRRAFNLFTYKGQLYTLFATNTSSFTLNIGRLDADITVVASVNVTGNNVEPRLSNWRNYRGIAYALMRKTGTNSDALFILSFDGTTLTVRNATEIGKLTNITANDPKNNIETMRLFTHDSRLFVCGQCCVPISNTEWRVRNLVFELDIQLNSLTIAVNPTIDPLERGVQYSGAFAVVDSELWKALDASDLASFSFNGNLYRVHPSGVVDLINDTTKVRTQKFDIRDSSLMAQGTVTTDAAGNSTFPLRFASTTPMGSWVSKMIGAKISYGGNDGMVVSHDVNYTDIRVRLLNGNAFPPIPSGAVVTVTRGFLGCLQGTKGEKFTTTFVIPRVVGSYVYIFVSGRNPLQNTLDNSGGTRSFMIRWDGTNAPTYYELFNAGLKPNIWGVEAYIDPEDGKIHIEYADANSSNLVTRHAYFDTNTLTWTEVGNIHPVTYSVNRCFIHPSGIVGYGANEGDSTIESISNNEAGTQVTLTYKLYSQNSHALNIALEYDIGNGYVSATEVGGGEGKTSLSSSPSGVTHTFIHNNNADLASFSGPVQYRIRILT